MSSLSDLPATPPLTHIASHCRRVTGDQTIDLIAAEAYFIAERRGFVAGGQVADWLQAERQVLAKFDGDYYCD